MERLKGKTALITGGSSGIGLATAKLFRDEGARVVVTGRDPERLAQATRELGEGVLAIRSEANKLDDIASVMDEVKARLGRLDVLIVNAGIAKAAPIDAISEEQFDAIMETNFKGAFFTIQKALPLFGDSGSIVVTTSIANRLGSPNFSVYGASKAALRSLVKSLGLELIGRGIRVNGVSPGPIETPIYDNFGLPQDIVPAIKSDIAQKSPSKRFGTPDEIAKAILFLASDDSAYMVGEEVVIDGGMSLL
ncbi:MAG TPA: SDR family oxidoreductase [Paucimonas sp.]|nr:SDR family oxidoreductase [Paucimonas sp.]